MSHSSKDKPIPLIRCTCFQKVKYLFGHIIKVSSFKSISSVTHDTICPKMFTRTRNRVISMAILPATTSGGMRNEAQDVITNRLVGR